MGPETFLEGAKNIFIGNRVRIFPGCRMETHDNGEIIIEDDCSIAQNFHVTSGGSQLIIGKCTTISGNVFITNIDHDYQVVGKHIMEQDMIYKKTIIGENCFIGFGAVIQAGTVLGKQCIVGANAVVRGTFPDYSVIVGVPGKIVKQYNEETGIWERWYKA
jgi:acetyltransferase-like isoleucine patch superfamily enzyme